MQKHTGSIIIAPRITEKGAYLSSLGAYVFTVGQEASKKEVATAIATLYKVTPRKVTLIAVPRKRATVRGTNRRGYSARGKKAYVYLNKGDTIEII